MIRVLHIVDTIGVRSGVMSLLMNYYRKIDKSRIQFDFLFYYDNDDNFKNEIELYGGKLYKVNVPSVGFSYLHQYEKILVENNYEIVHCHPIHSCVFFGKVSKKHGVKHFIQHSHSSKFGNNIISIIRNYFVMKIFNRYITDYVVCSYDALKLFPKQIKETNDYYVLKNAIDSKKYIFNKNNREKIRNEFNISSNTIVIGHVGRFSPEKNHKQLINIFSEYCKYNNDSLLFLVGDGIIKNEIEGYVRSLNLSNKVIFAGIRYDIDEILSSFDYFIFPSTYEGLGIVAIEAQANGLITICSKGVPDEAIISDYAIKTDTNNIQTVINILKDNNKYIRKNNYKLIVKAGYDINEQVKSIEKFYENLK